MPLEPAAGEEREAARAGRGVLLSVSALTLTKPPIADKGGLRASPSVRSLHNFEGWVGHLRVTYVYFEGWVGHLPYWSYYM